ncbi:hypothetical protein, partial [Nonomuraea sp. NPDC050691]|uniref:hypothetical protein n=1 Tax=Nonomuraea sp. NPDC050691 TaxID=3155661 RepID=UPI0033FE0BC7
MSTWLRLCHGAALRGSWIQVVPPWAYPAKLVSNGGNVSETSVGERGAWLGKGAVEAFSRYVEQACTILHGVEW